MSELTYIGFPDNLTIAPIGPCRFQKYAVLLYDSLSDMVSICRYRAYNSIINHI